jgi:elongation factor Ts
MATTLEQVKELREVTGASMMACKKALDENDGNMEKALDALRKRGEAKAGERSARTTGQGIVCSYIHGNNRLGVLLQLACETDFVARTDQFQTLARDLAMQVAATNPLTLTPEEVSPELVEKEREIWKEQLKHEGKKEQMFEKILEGKEKKFREEISLMKQAFIKNPDVTIEQILKESITKMGENIRVVRFARFSL